MFEKCLLILTMAGAVAFAAPFAAAQDRQSDDRACGQTNHQTRQTATRAHERGCGHRHDVPHPARRTGELTTRLNLTPEQQVKVLSALQSENSQLQRVRQDTSLSSEDARSKMRDIRTAAEYGIRAMLDSNQQKEWGEMQTKRGLRTGINLTSSRD